MTKEDIVIRVWNRLDHFNKKESAEIVDALLDTMKTVLANGEKLKFGGFGVFEVKRRKPRIGRNPKTGEEAQIKEGQTIKFKPGKPFKTAIAES
ncbi:HU family DNA-binding protein [bacterium]|nr:HU family DNA-binding protein [candidate division CSSED10-310 bacterium]